MERLRIDENTKGVPSEWVDIVFYHLSKEQLGGLVIAETYIKEAGFDMIVFYSPDGATRTWRITNLNNAYVNKVTWQSLIQEYGFSYASRTFRPPDKDKYREEPIKISKIDVNKLDEGIKKTNQVIRRLERLFEKYEKKLKKFKDNMSKVPCGFKDRGCEREVLPRGKSIHEAKCRYNPANKKPEEEGK